MEINITCADAYFTERLSSKVWFTLTNNQKQAALTTAKEKIYHLPFLGVKSDLNQSEPFPRFYKSMYITLPDDVVKGVFEEALSLVNKSAALNNTEIPEGIQSMSLGSASISFKSDSSGNLISISKGAAGFLDGWLRKGFDIQQEMFGEVY